MDQSISTSPSSEPVAAERKVFVNLGSGNKIYKSDPLIKWLNVDILEAPELQKHPEGVEAYYVVDDVRTLTKFNENSVDLIQAFHLVEHIPVYEIEKTIIRWFEILKPGGLLVVELPDLVKSCINFLSSLTTKDQTTVNNLGLYGIYGQPTPGNTFMEHKWGWIPDTLGQVFVNCGFEDVEAKMPQTHQGPVRDFRLEARKPL